MSETALIFGVTGQDGAYLARHLLEQGKIVHGTSRDREMAQTGRLKQLGIAEKVILHSAAVSDFRSTLQVIDEIAPDKIFNLSGQSSVGLSFAQPVETFEGIMLGTLNILESIRFLKRPTRFYNAGSSEMFGDTGAQDATEETPFHPRSPYAVAKCAAFWTVANYRESYGLYACSGILFNHESPLRPPRFVTRKIVRGVVEIATGRASGLKLGNLNITRDWGWAPDYVVAMARMLEQGEPKDLVIATGKAWTLEAFVDAAFRHFDLDWREHVEIDATLLRPADIERNVGCAKKAEQTLGWKPTVTMPQLLDRLIEAELASFE